MSNQQAEALIKRQARAWETADLEAIVADFAEEALFISPGGRWQGRAAIRSAAQAFFATVNAVQITVTRVLSDGNQGAVEWSWSEIRRTDGATHTAEDAIIFVVADEKIVYWREYFDTANF
jgi:uncharacterized protein (TIGR02246 family)